MKVKLFDYQEEFINAKEKLVIGNFARGLGKTFSLVNKIIKEKPKRVLWISPTYTQGMRGFKDNIAGMDNIRIIHTLKDNEIMLRIINDDFKNVTVINVDFKNNHDLIIKNNEYDLIVVDDLYMLKDLNLIPFNGQIICTTTENNSDKHLNNKYKLICEDLRIIDVGIYNGLKENITSITKNELFDMDDESYFNEFAILDDKNSDKFATIFDFFKEDKSKTNWFKEKIKELQNEYDSTPRCKNTLMTRKDIINLMETISALPEKFSKLNS